MGAKILENINIEDIKTYFAFLGHIETTEVRLIKPRWFTEKVLPPSYFVKSANELIEVCKKYNGEWSIYTGINDRKGNGKDDIDVPLIRNIGHDIDAHDSGDEGMNIAGQVAMKIREDYMAAGFKEPLIINSGYGYWVIHHIKPIENTEENIKKIKEFGKLIKQKYQVDKIDIDSSVYNPSRIGRVPGTLNIRIKDKPVLSMVMNHPEGYEDFKLSEEILNIKIQTYQPMALSNPTTATPSISSFMDYCLTHEIPQGERHKAISKNMAIYIAKHPDRELLKQQYCKIQKGSDGELDQWLKAADEGKEYMNFNVGQLVNFTKKYKIPFDWKLTPEYQLWQKEKKSVEKLQKEVEKEETAEKFCKAIKFFTDKKHLATQFLEVQPLYYDNSKLWWIWNFENKCWELCDEVDIMNLISKHSEANTINSTERNEILESLKQESRKAKPSAIEKTWIQFKDTIVDIYTGERIDPSPKYFTVNPIPWELGESEDTPNMDRIFKEWCGVNSVTLFQILSYTLLTDYPIHRIFCFIGEGMNGKSKYLDLLRKFIGNNNCCSTELDTLITSRFEVARLHKKLVCMMGETNFGELSKTSMLKKLSGGDLIGFEYKGKNPFEEKNYAKILISTNNLPATTDKTTGFYRRWDIIDFPNTFTEKKDILADIPEVEYNNLALKCCRILRELLNVREFSGEGTIEERKEKYESKSNFVEQFIKEFTRESYQGYITKSDFYKKFCAWSKENRHREMSETSVSMAAKKNGLEEDKKYFQWLFDGKGGQLRCWSGIEWK
jgi:P4 family phage/plasmid primase-like protien